METDVAAVEVDRVENLIALSIVVTVCVDVRLTAERDRFGLLLFNTAPKTSPLPVTPGNRFRDIASKPNIVVLERMLAVGVDGAELCPVRNLKSPN